MTESYYELVRATPQREEPPKQKMDVRPGEGLGFHEALRDSGQSGGVDLVGDRVQRPAYEVTARVSDDPRRSLARGAKPTDYAGTQADFVYRMMPTDSQEDSFHSAHPLRRSHPTLTQDNPVHAIAEDPNATKLMFMLLNHRNPRGLASLTGFLAAVHNPMAAHVSVPYSVNGSAPYAALEWLQGQSCWREARHLVRTARALGVESPNEVVGSLAHRMVEKYASLQRKVYD